jgi:hypothetical protein
MSDFDMTSSSPLSMTSSPSTSGNFSIDFNFPSISVDNNVLNYVTDISDINYYFLTANFATKGTSNLYSNKTKLHYTLENLYIVGPIRDLYNENANLILSFKSINDFNADTKPSTQYLCFPLNINTNSNNENLLTGLLNSAGNKSVSAIELNDLLPENSKDYSFGHMNPSNDMLDIDIYFYPDIINVYYIPPVDNSGSVPTYRWITSDTQKQIKSTEPIPLHIFIEKQSTESFTTIWSSHTEKESMDTITGTKNTNLSQEEKIYIKCAPAGASDKMETVHHDKNHGTHHKKGKHRDSESANMSFVIMATIVIVVNILVVGLGYKTIYLLLSNFFVKNVIESKGKGRRSSPFEMLVYWVADLFPHIFPGQWGDKRSSSENLIRVFVYAFYVFLALMIMYSLQHKNMNLFHLSIYILFIYISDIFFFFIQISNMNPESYDKLRDSRLNGV